MRRPCQISARWRAITAIPLLLLLGACGQMLPPAPQGTALPVPAAAPITWRRIALPVAIPAEPTPTSYLSPQPIRVPVVSLAADESAYECAPDVARGALPASVWVLPGHASTWQHTADLSTGEEIDRCAITVDQLDPIRAVALTFKDALDSCIACGDGDYRLFATSNGGHSWTPISGPFDTITQLATFGGATYALFKPHPADLQPLRTELAVSRDGLRTWQAADAALRAHAGRFATQFWLNPQSGALLAHTLTNSASWSDQFWESHDSGQTWDALTTPLSDEFVVQPPLANQPWRICGIHDSQTNVIPMNPHLLTCTSDSARTWVDRLDNRAPQLVIFALAEDGSVLAGDPLATVNGSAQYRMQRLAPGATSWEALGTSPSYPGYLTYVGGNGAGAIWLNPGLYPNTSSVDAIYAAEYV